MIRTSSGTGSDLVGKLRTLLRLTHVTQRDIAAALEIQPSQLNVYFTGKGDMHSKKLIRLLEVLGVDLNEILEQRIRELQHSNEKVTTPALRLKLEALRDHNRESLLRIIKALAG
jgi:transcriptional regulator with XRE-family HTH domain